MDSISNQLSTFNSLGTAINDDDDNMSVVTTQLGGKKGISKIQTKKKKDKQKKSLEKAISYQDRLDTTVVKDIHAKILKLPEEKQRKRNNTAKKKTK